jgi:hypothetical protein
VPEKTWEDHMVGFFFRIVTTLNMANKQWRPRSLCCRRHCLVSLVFLNFFFLSKIIFRFLAILRSFVIIIIKMNGDKWICVKLVYRVHDICIIYYIIIILAYARWECEELKFREERERERERECWLAYKRGVLILFWC